MRTPGGHQASGGGALGGHRANGAGIEDALSMAAARVWECPRDGGNR